MLRSTERKPVVRSRPNRKVAFRLGLSLVLFAASLATPAFHYDDGPLRQSQSGLHVIGLGWFAALFALLGLFRGWFELVGTLTWFVNPLLLAAWIQAWRGRGDSAVICAVAGFLLSLGFLAVHRIPVPDNGTMDHIVPGVGYALWVLSTLAAIAAAHQVGRIEAAPLRTFNAE